MAHTSDEVVNLAKDNFPDANNASRIHLYSDLEWWVVDNDCNTIAYAWFDDLDAFNIKSYKP